MAGCKQCEVQRTLLMRRLAIYAAVAVVAVVVWKKVRR
jgi:hypothetical protein